MRSKNLIEEKRYEVINRYFRGLNKDLILKDLCLSKRNIEEMWHKQVLGKSLIYQIEKNQIFYPAKKPESQEILK